MSCAQRKISPKNLFTCVRLLCLFGFGKFLTWHYVQVWWIQLASEESQKSGFHWYLKIVYADSLDLWSKKLETLTFKKEGVKDVTAETYLSDIKFSVISLIVSIHWKEGTFWVTSRDQCNFDSIRYRPQIGVLNLIKTIFFVQVQDSRDRQLRRGPLYVYSTTQEKLLHKSCPTHAILENLAEQIWMEQKNTEQPIHLILDWDSRKWHKTQE